MPNQLAVVLDNIAHHWRGRLCQSLDFLPDLGACVRARIWRGPDAVEVGFQLATASAQAFNGVEDTLVLEQLRLRSVVVLQYRARRSAVLQTDPRSPAMCTLP